MKPPIATTISQSRRLLACGVDPKTADMCIITYPNGNQQAYVGQVTINAGTIYTDGELQAENIDLTGSPAWSLSALLELLPNNIMAENRKQFTFCLCKCKTAYIVAYGDENTDLYQSNGATAIEACVRMIETLTFHKHELNKAEE